MYCKLTNQNLQTYCGFQWVLNEWKETSGEGELCSEGWLHCYTHPLLAVLLNPIHADIKDPRLFEIEVGGKIQEDYGLKVGFTKMRLMKEIRVPQVSDVQRIVTAVMCAEKVETNKLWLEWADNWLNNKDNSTATEIYKNKYSMSPYNCLYAASIHACYSVYAYENELYNYSLKRDVARAIECAARNKRFNLFEILDLIK